MKKKKLDYRKINGLRGVIDDYLLDALINAFLVDTDEVTGEPTLKALTKVVETYNHYRKKGWNRELTWENITKMFRQQDMTSSPFLDMVIWNLLNSISIVSLTALIVMLNSCEITDKQ